MLSRHLAAGLCLKKSKCGFLVSKVVYCGCSISGMGIQPVVGKVKAIQEAPAPTNYYHRFLPNMATTLELLHELLRQSTPWKGGGARTATSLQRCKGTVAIGRSSHPF